MLVSQPASADVKAGVDAWSRGEYAAAVKEWEGPAAQGDADAQFNLAQAYKWGKGVKQDLTRAEQLFGKAAAQGHLPASDNYGLLLFDRGERAMAMPYVRAAAGRGDSRAQYLLAIAHFNGDLMPRDWVRAYALMSLARRANLPQASAGLQQMDGFIPIEQRQQAAALAQELAAEAEATRNRQVASAGLGLTPAPPLPAAAPPSPPRTVLARQPGPDEAIVAASRVAAGSSPASAGADYARPVKVAPLRPAAPAPAPTPAPAPAGSGGWRIQLGAFSLAANADALWSRLRARPEIAGHPRIDVPAGPVTKLQAGGYEEEAARSACARLAADGQPCIAVHN